APGSPHSRGGGGLVLAVGPGDDGRERVRVSRRWLGARLADLHAPEVRAGVLAGDLVTVVGEELLALPLQALQPGNVDGHGAVLRLAGPRPQGPGVGAGLAAGPRHHVALLVGTGRAAGADGGRQAEDAAVHAVVVGLVAERHPLVPGIGAPGRDRLVRAVLGLGVEVE